MTDSEWKILYNLAPEEKVERTRRKFKEFYNYFSGQVFVSVSGGKDSSVLAHIVKHLEAPYNDTELVFFDTHNEDPTVYEIVRKLGATVISSPYTPAQVVEQFGYPLFNKETAHIISAIRRGAAYISGEGRSERNKQLIDQVKNKYKLFIDSPLEISDACCNYVKKKPSEEFTKQTGKYPVLATLAVESFLRIQQYKRRGCNAFEGKIQSTPIGFWKPSDVLWYIANYGVEIASCYAPKIVTYPLLGYKTCTLTGKDRTGCLYCGFGKGIQFAKKVLKAKCPEYVKEHQEEFDALR